MRVLAGDWKQGEVVLRRGILGQPKFLAMPGKFPYERVDLSELETVDVVSADDKASITGKVVAGATGAVLLGPVGLLAGAIAGGQKRKRVVTAVFKDGRRALIECKPEELTALQTASFH